MATNAKSTVQSIAGRTLPHNIEAEQSVLGCVLIDNDAGINTFGKLTTDDFYGPTHKIIFGAMKGIFEKNTPVDLVTVCAVLDNTGNLEKVGGAEYLSSLNDIVPSSANINHYIDILKKFSNMRKLIGAGNKIIEQSYNSEDDRAALALAEKLIFDISREGERKELTHLGSIMPVVLDKLDTIQKDPSAMRGIKTGFYGLDNLTNGLQKSNLIILAARPGGGKTSLGLNIVTNAAIKRKAKCAIFSLEMSKEELGMRAVCSVAEVSMTKATHGQMSSDEWKKIWLANKVITDANIYVDDNSVITPAEILAKCMRLKREQGLDLVMVDYLGLMTGGTGPRRESRQVEVADNSRAMKILAKELDIPVLLLSQLNRNIDTRKGPDSKPVLSDLRESGAIEQDADIVMFVNIEKNEDAPTEDAELIIAKNRNGPSGVTVKLRWVSECTTFKNSPTDQNAQEAKDKLPTLSKSEQKANKKIENQEQVAVVLPAAETKPNKGPVKADPLDVF